MVDIGLLDIITGQNDHKDLSDLGDPHMTSFEFQNILNEGLVGGTEARDLLDISIQQNGIIQNKQEQETSGLALPPWDDDADSFLQSMLTGADHLDSQLGLNVETTTQGLTVDTSFNVETTPHLNTPRALVSPGLDDSSRLLDTSSRLLSPGLDDISPCTTSGFMPSGMDMDMDNYSTNSGSLISPELDSPYPNSPQSTHSMDLIDYISNDSDGGDGVGPCGMVSGADPVFQTSTGTTTIILPITDLRQITDQPVTVSNRRLEPRDQRVGNKRRRNSASSNNSDSGVEDTSNQGNQGKYPRLELNEEELRMCAKEGLSFPSHYPLTREEERNLKRVRRKIRNKVSAQDSRKRKKEYMDNMEDRVKLCADENQELKDKIKILESQNKTLAAQLRRLHQIVVNGGFRHGQTSTALMVLLLSTALFLIPGLRDQPDTKPEIDILRAVKLPPMPGQSRSLLQFNSDPLDMTDFQDIKPLEGAPSAASGPQESNTDPAAPSVTIKVEKGQAGVKPPPHTDHDYTYTYTIENNNAKAEPGSAWIEEDAPPKGYGAALKSEEEAADRHMNVNVSSSGQGTRKVILQIPKDIK